MCYLRLVVVASYGGASLVDKSREWGLVSFAACVVTSLPVFKSSLQVSFAPPCCPPIIHRSTHRPIAPGLLHRCQVELPQQIVVLKRIQMWAQKCPDAFADDALLDRLNTFLQDRAASPALQPIVTGIYRALSEEEFTRLVLVGGGLGGGSLDDEAPAPIRPKLSVSASLGIFEVDELEVARQSTAATAAVVAWPGLCVGCNTMGKGWKVRGKKGGGERTAPWLLFGIRTAIGAWLANRGHFWFPFDLVENNRWRR